ncbi:MAG TPA: hypothetical protein PKA63_09535 [Oligoflexia bacterium]|nr:hypothetical protein [Oligoflexia bacterium]HMP48895.1 hypothetical protein [Oligoflexia bacterium]
MFKVIRYWTRGHQGSNIHSPFGRFESSDHHIGGTTYSGTFGTNSSGGSRVWGVGIWLPMFFVGLFLICLSVILVLKPELLAFFFAGILMFFGIAIASTALFFRGLR